MTDLKVKTTYKDISVFGNLPPSEASSLSADEESFLVLAQNLDNRFRPQFTLNSFKFRHTTEGMHYLPEDLRNDQNLFKDKDIKISYNYWACKNNAGPAKTIICLGGIYNAARRFDFFAEKASETANVVVLDYPGKGHSGNFPLPQDYSLENYAKIVKELINHINPPEDIHFIAHSHGAKVLYTMVEQGFNDTRWKTVVIGDMPPETPHNAQLRRAWRNRERPGYPTIDRAINSLTKFVSGHGPSIPLEFVVHDFNHGFSWSPREGYGWGYDPNSMQGYCDEYLKPYNKWDAFKKIPANILLLAGEKSNTVTPDLAQKMITARPDMSVFLYEETGHYPELFTPQRTGEIVSWIEDSSFGPQRGYIPAAPERPIRLQRLAPTQQNTPDQEHIKPFPIRAPK